MSIQIRMGDPLTPRTCNKKRPFTKTHTCISLQWIVWFCKVDMIHPQTSDMNRTLVDNIIADHSDVVEASPVGADPTTLLEIFKGTCYSEIDPVYTA